jgi:hypothetical protein
MNDHSVSFLNWKNALEFMDGFLGRNIIRLDFMTPVVYFLKLRDALSCIPHIFYH